MVNETFVEVRGTKLFLRGDGAGEPLLFLHGVQGLPGWTDALARLAEHFTVIAPDHPGFGHSDAPDGIDDVGDLAYFYLDLLAGLANGRVHIVGHSLGGWIAMAMAIRSTAQILSLTLVDAAGISVDGVKRGDMFIGSPAETGKLLFAGEEAASRWAGLWQASDEMRETLRQEPRRRGEIHLAAAALRSEAGALAPSHQRADAYRLGRGRFPDPAGAWRRAATPHSGRDADAHRRYWASRRYRGTQRLRRCDRSFHCGAGAMKVLFFHLMPYADLDLDYQQKYRTDWVILPNTYFDPKKGHVLYNRYLDELELAAELGFDGVSVNEHHQNAYGLMPSPVVTASALARRVKTAKIAILGNAFGLARQSAHACRRACDDRRHHRRTADLRHGAWHRRRILLAGRQPGFQP